MDIGGNPPFPTGSKQFSGNFGNLLFLAGFNFRDHFEGLNEGFLRSRFSMIAKGDRMQKLRPREVDVLTYPNGARMTFGASSPRVRFLDF